MTIDPSRAGRLEGDALDALLSPYWAGGYREDEHSIDWIHIDGRTAKASCGMSRYYSSPTDSVFHLSVFNATAFLCQIGIAHALFLSGRERKDLEAWLTDYTLLLPSKIRTPHPILIELHLVSHTVTPSEEQSSHYSFFRWDFVIDAKWRGFFGIAFPFAQ
jgi:hypothetical protein